MTRYGEAMARMRNRERAGSQRALSERVRSVGVRLVAVAAALAMLVSVAIVSGAIQPAWAVEYPTWDDVAAVRNDQAAAEAQIRQIEAILSGLQAEAARTQADAETKGNLYQEADNAYQAKAEQAKTLQGQADASNALAEASEQRAGQVAAQLMRGGAEDLTVTLLVTGDQDNLLNRISTSKKITEQAQAVYVKAQQDRNIAQAQTDAANVAKRELEILKVAAEKAFQEAQAAAATAATALQEQLDNQARLQQQIIVLRERRAATEADYQTGVRERFAAAANLDAGYISDSGWVKPSGGYITSSYGYRASPAGFHKGTDLGAGCGANIYAATTGTVVYAAYGYNGGYGNYIIIDHGDGVETAYGHIAAGGILVSAGEHLDIGQVIAYAGNTGFSFGCHLHFEVRIGGDTTNPVPYMASQGIQLG